MQADIENKMQAQLLSCRKLPGWIKVRLQHQYDQHNTDTLDLEPK